MKFDLTRFKKAQENDYEIALAEIKNGHKESHWIWYIFPQLKELGFSSMSQYYGLTVDEARSYIEDDLLRTRLVEISTALLNLDSNDASEVMGYPDDLKLKSCMTLFAEVAPQIDVFTKVLEKFYNGTKDDVTLKLISEQNKK